MARLNITLNDELIEDIDYQSPKEKCKTRSEFIEKAVKFYLSYLETDNSYEYLNKSVMAGVRKGIGDIEKQTMPNIFRLSVELSMLMNVVAAMVDIDKKDLHNLRIDCIKAIKATDRRCTFEKAMRYQNTEEPLDDFFENFSGKLEIDIDDEDYE